nr:alcohol dehydrogenase catalytic domain-containing protein [Nocardioides alcanivorans]
MKAFVLHHDGWGLADVADPVAGPGRVVVQTSAAGLCHSDLTLAARPPDLHPFALPLVLGHELAGTVVEVGTGVVGLRAGDRVVGYGPRGVADVDGARRGPRTTARSRPPSSRPAWAATEPWRSTWAWMPTTCWPRTASLQPRPRLSAMPV